MAKVRKIISKADQKEKIAKADLETPLTKEKPIKFEEEIAEVKERAEELKTKEVRQIRDQIEKTDLDDQLKIQAATQAQSIKQLDEEKKIKKLLALAKSKGVIYAVNVAKKMDDPYVLDLLHDILAQEGYYKKFIK